MPEEFYLTKLIAPLISHLKETEQHSKRTTGENEIQGETASYPILILGNLPTVSLTPLHLLNFSNICAIGPPPPSPFPNTKREVLSSFNDLCCVTERIRSPTLAWAVYVSAGHI